MSKENEPIFSVSEFIEAINLVVGRLGKIKIKGEISVISGTQRGYAFFDLRDSQNEECLIKCVIFRHNFAYFSHLLEEGAEVVIFGRGNIYPKNGSFRVVVEGVEPVGVGAYAKAFQQLKKKLSAKGYFDEKRKRPVPFSIEKIGLITSSHGAVIEDFRENVGEFGFEIFLKNIFVEGDKAEESIIKAIEYVNLKKPDLDVVVLIRGGGGWESFKAFNSEKVVEAIVSSRIPIITGVGHDTDETMAGMSSDLDLSTPTAVAIFIRNQKEELIEKLSKIQGGLIDCQRERLHQREEKINDIFSRMQKKVDVVFERFDFLKERVMTIIESMIVSLERKEDSLWKYQEKIRLNLKEKIGNFERIIELARAKVDSINPDYILRKGYGMVFDEKGTAITASNNLKIGQKLKIKFHQGSVVSEVLSKE